MGGAEKLISDLLPSIRTQGIDCSVLALDGGGDAFSGALREGGVPVRFARADGASPYSPARIADIRAVLRDERPNIVHAHLGPSFHWCALAVSGRDGPRLVATEHASANRRMSMPFMRGIERRLYGRYDRIICVSEDAAASLRTWLGVEDGKLPVVPNGIVVRRYSEATAAPDVVAALRGRKGIAMVARFIPLKDHRSALESLRLLPDDYALVMAGDGDERAAIEARAMELGIAERCLFLGARADVPGILAACSCYLQSSKIEGFGIAALEAMAAGLPVAANDAPGLSGLVQGAGIVYAFSDPSACASAIRSLHEDAELRERCIQAGRARAAGHSIVKTAAAYARLYRGLCPGGEVRGEGSVA